MPKNVLVGERIFGLNFERHFHNYSDVHALFISGFMGVTCALDKNVGKVILGFF